MMGDISVNWTQVLANTVAFIIIASALIGVLYKALKAIINAQIEPAIKKVTEQQKETLDDVLKLITKLRDETSVNTSRISYLEGVAEGHRQAQQNS